MTNQSENDKQLLENIERILAGKDNGTSQGDDKDTQTATDFARKMASLKETPSKEYKAKLKAQLTHQLNEQKQKEGRNQSLLFWEIRNRTMWQWTIAALLAFLITVIILAVMMLVNRGG
jgi:hypothetical protein